MLQNLFSFRWNLVWTIFISISGIFNVPVQAENKTSLYWRFEQTLLDENGQNKLHVFGKEPAYSTSVGVDEIALTKKANQFSLVLKDGYLKVPAPMNFNMGSDFTVEFWVKFGHPVPSSSVAISMGSPDKSGWAIVSTGQGDVFANIYGSNRSKASLFNQLTSYPVPDQWYHIGAVYESVDKATVIHTYVNGNLRDEIKCPILKNDDSAELCIGADAPGRCLFTGQIDELRITPNVLKPEEFTLADSNRIFPEEQTENTPLFVEPGTKIDAELRNKAADVPILAKPYGYTYFFKRMCAFETKALDPVPEGYDKAFGTALLGSSSGFGAVPAGYHIAVPCGGRYVVLVGYFDPVSKPGKNPQIVAIEGKRVDQIDAAGTEDSANKPFIKKYIVNDENRDGILTVCSYPFLNEISQLSMINVIWVFDASLEGAIDITKLLDGSYDVPPLYYIDCGRDKEISGSIVFPDLSPRQKAKALPLVNLLTDMDPGWPQMVDPLNIQIRGDLADRINTWLTRWGYVCRDQKIVGGWDTVGGAAFETTARAIDILCRMSRLMGKDFNAQDAVEELLKRQDRTSKHPGSFLGGTPARSGYLWAQAYVLTGLLSYYDMTGDKRILESADKLMDFFEAYLNNPDPTAGNYYADEGVFKQGGTVYGYFGKGAIGPIMTLYNRTRNPRYLEIAQRMAQLNRENGAGVSWLISGDSAEQSPVLNSWPDALHLHETMTTLRGFPWFYAASNDSSYLNDAITGFYRVRNRCMYQTGGVLEKYCWTCENQDPHDEVCQTRDLLQMAYLLGDVTYKGEYFDQAEEIYYNHIRYNQIHQSDFLAYNRLPGPTRGHDGWWCCGWSGALAMYETATHLYAQTADTLYVNDFLPSSVKVKLNGSAVTIDTNADIPKSGRVSFKIDAKPASNFKLKIRIPGWAEFKNAAVNGKTIRILPQGGYISINEKWHSGDVVDVDLVLPLRVKLDSFLDNLPAANVSLDGNPPVEARCISIYKGPFIITQFRLAAGCDLNWAYTGDHPDLFETLESSFVLADSNNWKLDKILTPESTTVRYTKEGVLIQCKIIPHQGWVLKRNILIAPRIPVTVKYESELIAPSAEDAGKINSIRLCGVRMRDGGNAEYGPVKLLSGRGKWLDFNVSLPESGAVLDNGYVQFKVISDKNELTGIKGDKFAGIYSIPKVEATGVRSSCTLEIAGQSQFTQPLIHITAPH